MLRVRSSGMMMFYKPSRSRPPRKWGLSKALLQGVVFFSWLLDKALIIPSIPPKKKSHGMSHNPQTWDSTNQPTVWGLVGCFQKWGYPQNGWSIMEIPLKMGWFGEKKTYFRKHPRCSRQYFYQLEMASPSMLGRPGPNVFEANTTTVEDTYALLRWQEMDEVFWEIHPGDLCWIDLKSKCFYWNHEITYGVTCKMFKPVSNVIHSESRHDVSVHFYVQFQTES